MDIFDNKINDVSRLIASHPALEDLAHRIIELLNHFKDGFELCAENYKRIVIETINKYPISIGSNNSLYTNYGDHLYDNEASSELASYISSLETIEKYLVFLKYAKTNVVFVGANGSGKTTLVKKLQSELKDASMLFFPADRMLVYKSGLQTQREWSSLVNLVENTYKHSLEQADFSADYSINLFTYYIDYLLFQFSHENHTNTYGSANKVINEWNNLIKTRTLYIDGNLCVKPTDADDSKKYTIFNLSSGEKSILFFLMSVLLNDTKTYYFVDEPENNLNPAIVSELWDFLEKERPNSTFIYLTHDNTFATSRINTKEYWIQNFDGDNWKYEPIDLEKNNLPKTLLVELLGTKQPVIFCESENDSKLDYNFFKFFFPNFKIVSSGGCGKVISNTKAYKELKPNEKAYGIIDRDYKNEDFISGLVRKNVYSLPTFEIENLLAYEDFVKAVISKWLGNDSLSKVDDVKKWLKTVLLMAKISGLSDMWLLIQWIGVHI